MLTLSQSLVAAATFLAVLCLAVTVLAVVTRRVDAPAPVAALVAVGGAPGNHAERSIGQARPRSGRIGSGAQWYARLATSMTLAVLTGALIARGIAVGHGPFANQYEFAVAFAWGMLAAYAYAVLREARSPSDTATSAALTLGVVVLPLVLAALLYASSTSGSAGPLVPALQHNLLLTVHVFSAVVAYGAAAVAAGAAVLSLAGRWVPASWQASPARLDRLGYRAVAVAFPLMTVMLVLGSVWAERAWGRYWNWDPKETAALVTWLIYGAYLHARVAHGWRGNRAAWLLVLGFGAVVFTYLGNLFLGGLHSYA